MSAFIVTPRHLAEVAKGAVGRYSRMSFGEVMAVAETLARENVRSVNHRYPSDNVFADDFVREVEAALKGVYDKPQLKPLELLKLTQSYAYQACECDDWEKTKAFDLTNIILGNVIQRLEGYDQADWVI